VELELADSQSARGFITRLSPVTATVSTDPGLEVGQVLRLRFHRPTDGQPVDVEGSVHALVNEGGLWRGRPAALIELNEAVQDDFAADSSDLRVRVPNRERRGTQLTRRASDTQGVSMGQTFKASGLGRRRRPGSAPPPIDTPESAPPAQPEPSPDSQQQQAPEGQVATAESAADSDLRGLASIDISHDVPLLQPSTGEGDVPEAEDDLFDIFDADEDPDLDGVAGDPGTAQDSAEGVLATTSYPGPHGDVSPATSPMVLGPGQVATGSTPPVQEEDDTIPARSRDADERPPWEAGAAEPEDPSVPRHVRISSQIEVTFWARGRSNTAIAQNFSKEGLFLSFAGDPPIRGAIVRVEFPMVGPRENLPVRFNAEVRWHRGDQPGLAMPDGFGVQILTFESPKDQNRYEQLLALLLQVTPSEGKPPPLRFGNPKRRG